MRKLRAGEAVARRLVCRVAASSAARVPPSTAIRSTRDAATRRASSHLVSSPLSMPTWSALENVEMQKVHLEMVSRPDSPHGRTTRRRGSRSHRPAI